MARLINLAAVVAVAAVVLALASCAASQAPAAAPAPAASVDCSSAVTGLIGCLPYVQQGSKQGKPARECCAGVKAALQSPATVACLCAAFGQNYGIPLNLTRAAALPAACGEDPAALSKCNIQVPGAPASAPTGSTAPGTAPAAPSPGSSKSAAVIRSPVSAFAVVAPAVAAILLSHTFL